MLSYITRLCLLGANIHTQTLKGGVKMAEGKGPKPI